MDRVNGADHFDIGGGRRGFRSQNALLGIPGTEVTDDWLNGAQEEIMAVIEKTGQVPTGDRLTQLLEGIRSQVLNFGTDTGTADAMTVTLDPVLLAYQAGFEIRVLKAGAGNTAADPTINISGLGAKAVKRRDGTAVEAGDLPANALIDLLYDGTNFRVMSILRSDIASDPPPPPGYFFARGAVDTNVGANTWTKVTLGDEVNDPDGWFNPATSRFTPLKPGLFLVGGSVNFGSHSDLPTTGARIYHNGIVTNGGFPTTVFGSQSTSLASGSVQVVCGVTTVDGIDDYLELYAYKGTTAANNYVASGARFWGYYLGPLPS